MGAVSPEVARVEPPDPVTGGWGRAVSTEKQGRLPGGGGLWAEEGGLGTVAPVIQASRQGLLRFAGLGRESVWLGQVGPCWVPGVSSESSWGGWWTLAVGEGQGGGGPGVLGRLASASASLEFGPGRLPQWCSLSRTLARAEPRAEATSLPCLPPLPRLTGRTSCPRLGWGLESQRPGVDPGSGVEAAASAEVRGTGGVWGARRGALLEQGWVRVGFLGEGPLVHRTPLWPSGCLLPETEGTESQVDIPEILRTACGFGGGLLPAAPWFPRRGLLSSVVAPATSTHVLRGPLGHLASMPTPPWLRPGQAGPEDPGGPHLSLLPCWAFSVPCVC